MYTYKFIFTKLKDIRFISHLDLMRLFVRALRRADLPLKLSQGFNPHPKLSLKTALKLGLESDYQEASVILKEFVRIEDFRIRFQNQLPEGITIKAVTL